jgi:hypothetical protein
MAHPLFRINSRTYGILLPTVIYHFFLDCFIIVFLPSEMVVIYSMFSFLAIVSGGGGGGGSGVLSFHMIMLCVFFLQFFYQLTYLYGT